MSEVIRAGVNGEKSEVAEVSVAADSADGSLQARGARRYDWSVPGMYGILSFTFSIPVQGAFNRYILETAQSPVVAESIRVIPTNSTGVFITAILCAVVGASVGHLTNRLRAAS